MSEKDCGNHGDDKEKLYRRLFAVLLAFVVIILFIIFIFWLVVRPTKPSFVLQDATVVQFNSTSLNFLNTNVQVTLSSRNPNDRVGIYYDRLEVFATYLNQQVTLRTVLPPTYQGHGDIIVWAPFLSGPSVPVAPYIAASLSQAQSYGTAFISVRVDGSLRWKVGTWTSGHYHLYVQCDAYLSLAGRSGNPQAFYPLSRCYTDI